ncbi:MAG TPA: serine hydrolase domain-containing protein, partial [Chitinophagaceae bacterium]
TQPFMKKCLLLFISLLAIKSYGQVTQRLDSLFDFCHNKFLFNGTVLVAEKDQIVYERPYGYANLENKTPNTSDTKFRLGSISKQFTAFIILKLAEQGKLDLNKPAFAYLGHDETQLKGIYIRNLLTHTSGLKDYTGLPEFDEKKSYTHEDILQKIINAPLVFSPGSNYRYSNSNFFVLALVAEKVTGEKFEMLLSDIILNKAGMRNSGEDNDDQYLAKAMARPYMMSYNKLLPAGSIEMKNTIGGGGMYSTARDIFLWSTFFQKEFTDKSGLNKFVYSFSNHNPAGYYSSGWFIKGSHLFHEGHISGFANLISIDTASKQTIIILTNSDFQHLYPTMLSAKGVLNNDPAALQWIKGEKANVKDYLGKYRVANINVEIKEENGQLFGDSPTGRVKLIPFDKDQFYFDNREAFIVFKRNERGQIISLSSFEDYEWVELKKID